MGFYFYEKPDIKQLEEFLLHFGTPHNGNTPHSGRYPWGSGENGEQRTAKDFVTRVNQMRRDKPVFHDDREFLVDHKGHRYPNKDYGKDFYGDTAIAKIMGMSTKEFRAMYTIAFNEQKTDLYNRVLKYSEEEHLGPTEIGKKVGIPESSVRSLLKSGLKVRQEECLATADFIRDRVDKVGMVQVGSGVEAELGITRNRLDTALEMLKGEGYEVYSGRVPQTTDKSKQSTFKVICPPGTEHKEIYNYGKVNSIVDYKSEDGGQTFTKKAFQYPRSLDSKRIMIRYGDEGGAEKDGIIEIKRNVPDLSLGKDAYAQVRILVDNTGYLKGMAMYGDDKDFPPGVDVIFNSHHMKEENYNNIKSIKYKDKENTIPADNPFGSSLREEGGQYTFIDVDGKEKLSLINKTRVEGDWNDWSNKVPSQFLSKQSKELAGKQLKLTVDLKKDELKDIMALENPTVKKSMLDSFAEDCDSVAVHLKAASLPRQRYQVILPINNMKDDEVYAPNYRNGEKVALIRYPHGGTFEIPILTVNNNQKDAVRILGKNVQDCVGVNSEVAKQLSGADFDGDTVMVIPTNDKVKITSSKPLPGLKDYDMEGLYGCDPNKTYTDDKGVEHYFNHAGVEFKPMIDTQMEMGKISNLISDMTIKGATLEELEPAVKQSMIVIDAAKHHYDYQQAEKDNHIDQLKKRYQKKVNEETGKVTYGGAATLISQAKSPVTVPKRQGSPKVNIKGTDHYDPSKPEGALLYKDADDKEYLGIKVGNGINPKTGKKKTRIATVYERNGKYYYNRSEEKGVKDYVEVEDMSKVKLYERTTDSNKMSETDDAFTLVSEANSAIERLYATFANDMKSLANKARVESYNTKEIEYNSAAAITYKKEIKELNDELLKAEKNAPREKQALLISNERVKNILATNYDIDKGEEKKIRQQELTRARNEVGAHRYSIEITDAQWQAIQAGAISKTKLKKILNHTDTDKLKERATPRNSTGLSATKVSIIKSMSNRGYTASEIADYLGIGVTTVYNYVNEDRR